MLHLKTHPQKQLPASSSLLSDVHTPTALPKTTSNLSKKNDVLRLFAGKAAKQLDLQAKEGFCKLHLAAEKGDVKAIEACIRVYLVNIRRRQDGITPLHLAARSGHLGAVVALICELGIDLDPVDSNQSTPLHFAAENGHAEVVALLIGKRARTDLKRFDGLTPLQLAIKGNHQNVLDIWRQLKEEGLSSTGIRFISEHQRPSSQIAVENSYDESAKRQQDGRWTLPRSTPI